jgi:hypothetical protein
MGTMEPAVTDPPCGKTTKVMKLRAVARATKIDTSAIILVENWFSVLSVVFSLRQYYLVQVHWVDNSVGCPLSRVRSQLPETLKGIMFLVVF